MEVREKGTWGRNDIALNQKREITHSSNEERLSLIKSIYTINYSMTLKHRSARKTLDQNLI